ncbi:inositol 1,4,5-trisphosphate receptor-interacting protein-like 1 [Numida meleagris]|uniref:inositol 1,4,5-trisphosphate receptor-interacting protein-like 1 n=1 Tax=Numida meleagris TaxID=8996 RepID=UPI000B3E0B16|nr:inositol 1,4,5-trisphosphate receptor-interacting protein-like 1 [Numida meleagris]
MALAFVFALLVQWVARVGDQFNAVMLNRMQQYEVYVLEQMSRLLQKIEERNQRDPEKSRVGVQALLFSALHSWRFWASAGVLVLLLVLFRCHRRRKGEMHAQDMSLRCKEHVEDDDKNNAEVILYGKGETFSTEKSSCPLTDEQLSSKVVEELLSVCQTISRRYSVPRLQPVTGMDVVFEGEWRSGGYAIHCMLVPLRPPPGHLFCLELGPEEQTGLRKSRLRVELMCTCIRARLVGDVPCFLHKREKKLEGERMPSLLQTLCSGSYLDVQKTASWLQELVAQAWAAMPEWASMQLQLLPSARFCKIKLTTASSRSLYIELVLGVREGGPDAFLTFE